MTIVQISDLHFGNHNQNLAEALHRRMQAVKPDVIVVTGDLADEPKKEHFNQALQYLQKLEKCCVELCSGDERKRPRLICVPGNHDFLRKGYFPRVLRNVRLLTAKYSTFFSQFPSSFFFQPENVWIFGFDSAKCQTTGGAGAVDKRELGRFHAEYDALRDKYESEFEDAFKIALVHHHPLPVDWGTNWRQRWLTMTNSGTFLASVLHKKIDLVLHGHEHIQAHARLRSSLGGAQEAEAQVISLGATLARENNGRNWFNVISVNPDKTVDVTSYPSFDQDFEDIGYARVARSREEARDAVFETWKKTSGFCYDEVTSTTMLDKDGDAKRTLEFNSLRITHSNVERARTHVVEFSYTSGDINIPKVTCVGQCDLAGIRFVEPLPDREEPHRTLTRTIDWGRALQPGESVSYCCSWFAVNGFAMDQQQFEKKYLDASGMEFTHLPVNDPIDELLIIVQFPNNFRLEMAPQIRVSKHDREKEARSWERNYQAEHELRQSGALRYVRSIRVAALRIRRPLKGYSYGIQWRVPDSPSRVGGVEAAQIRGIITALSRPTASETSRDRIFLELLGRISIIARESFRMGNWANPLETAFMIFDATIRKLRIVGVSVTQLVDGRICVSHREPPHPRNIMFDYGDGIAGRAFKTNECRLYVDVGQEREEPDYYRQIPGQSPHAVLLSMPVRNPVDEAHAYGVLNFASLDPACPLRNVAFPNLLPPVGSAPAKIGDTLAQLQRKIDVHFLESLSAAFP